MAEWHDATEEYLEAILELEEEGTLPIRARLVERLGVSAPSVSETVNRLVDHGYAELLEASREPGAVRVGDVPRDELVADREDRSGRHQTSMVRVAPKRSMNGRP